MPPTPDELEGLTTFVAVVEAKGFRAAAARLGVSHTAVSQALRRLEARLGVALVQRTTRSVRPTEAGERLYAAARAALEEVRGAAAELGELADAPRGTLRLHVSTGAHTVLAGPLLAGFLRAHPQVRLDVSVSDEPLDIVAAGFDGGIQLGEVVDRDMIAVPVTGDIRQVVVGAPDYFARHRPPAHPRELGEHECLNWRPTHESPPYRWEFTEDGRDFSVAAPARVLTNDWSLNLRLVRAGMGLTIVYEDEVRDDVARGELVAVLEEFSTPFPGYYLYYPQRRHAAPALRALIDHLRQARKPTSEPGSSAQRGGGAPRVTRARGSGGAKR
jgi:DNA-binding transcriptional LysR family regulator